MDKFEGHFDMLRKNEKIFKKYSVKKQNGIAIPIDKEDDFKLKGKQLLSQEKANYFLEIRSIYCWNIVNMELKNYSFPEWVICIEESVLLEYAIPILSRVLQEYPMLCGKDCEWQVLYKLTKVEKEFWLSHKNWKEFFVELINRIFASNKKEDLIVLFPEDYYYQFIEFCSFKEI